MKKPIRAAAVQLAAKIGDSDANIERVERLSIEAVHEGASWIALPEFFNTGICWNPEIARAIQPMDGPCAIFLRDFSASRQVVIGGSFLCRLPDGSVRNRYLCYAHGSLVGWHDKDLPTMWENAFYEGGARSDTGVLGTYDTIRVGSALCWEYMRTMTARRLRNQVDLIMGGSCWWSIPTHFPSLLQRLWEPGNRRNALLALQESARLIGAPVIHGAHCGDISCPMPGMPLVGYRGFFEGNAAVVDGDGTLIAHRPPEQGEGIILGEIRPGARFPSEAIPRRYWLLKRGLLPMVAWRHQRFLGRRWYARNVCKR